VFTLLVFALAALLTTNLRRGKNGLAMVAMRDSQIALSSLGTSVVRLKFVSFCLSAFLAGVGGGLFAAARGVANSADWIALASLLVLALAVIGGIGKWGGALIGAALFELFGVVVHQPVFVRNIVFKSVFHGQLEALLPVTFGLGAIGLASNPNGIIEQTREGIAEARERRRARRAPQAEPAVASRAIAAGAGDAREDAGDQTAVLVAPNARYFHRPSCRMLDGKTPRTATAARRKKLTPCPMCEPVLVAPGRDAAPKPPRAGRTPGGGGRTRPLTAPGRNARPKRSQ
jgi:hypothetical protein